MFWAARAAVPPALQEARPTAPVPTPTALLPGRLQLVLCPSGHPGLWPLQVGSGVPREPSAFAPEPGASRPRSHRLPCFQGSSAAFHSGPDLSPLEPQDSALVQPRGATAGSKPAEPEGGLGRLRRGKDSEFTAAAASQTSRAHSCHHTRPAPCVSPPERKPGQGRGCEWGRGKAKGRCRSPTSRLPEATCTLGWGHPRAVPSRLSLGPGPALYQRRGKAAEERGDAVSPSQRPR